MLNTLFTRIANIIHTYYMHITYKQNRFASLYMKHYEFNFLRFIVKLFVCTFSCST